jgi:hypothetical protein
MFLIITTVGVLIIILVINIFMGRLNDEVSEDVCRASILARAKAVFKVKVLGHDMAEVSLLPITCKTKENVELSGDRDAMLEQISYMSARCWWMFLNGEYRELFSEANFLGKKKCFMCYIFNVKTNLDDPITADEIIKYMDTHYYIGDQNNNGITYLEYIQSYKGEGRILMDFDVSDEDNSGLSIEEGIENYVIGFISPDSGLWETIKKTSITWNPLIRGTEKQEKIEDMVMNSIYIEELDAVNEIEDGTCWPLESI